MPLVPLRVLNSGNAATRTRSGESVPNRLTPATVFFCALVMTGCNTPATVAPEEPRDPNSVPELTLNLPEARDCECNEAPSRDFTFLERGYSALTLNEYEDAVAYFQRYRRLEKTPEARWEADIGIAFVSMLPNSPFFNAEEARKAWRELNKQLTPDMQVHDKARLMNDALAGFSLLDRRVKDLEDDNSMLSEDLEKREEALKRLRELTLGQAEE